MAHSIRIPRLMKDLSSSEWTRFVQEFQIYLVATEKEFSSERVKIALFLNFAGSEALKLYEVKLKSNEGCEQTLTEIFDYFEDFCVEISSEVFERYCFYRLKQEVGQKFSEFSLVLKHQAAKCNFSEEESMVRDAIVWGVLDNDLRERLLTEQDLTLIKAERECKRAEIASSRLRLRVDNDMSQLKEEFCDLVNSDVTFQSVSGLGVNEFQSVTSDYQSAPVEFSSIPQTPDFQSVKDYTNFQQTHPLKEYVNQSYTDYQSVNVPLTPKEHHNAIHNEFQPIKDYSSVQQSQLSREYSSSPTSEYHPVKEFVNRPQTPTQGVEYHTAHQEYQTVEYQTVQQSEYQSVQPEYHPPPAQPPPTPQPQTPRNPPYGSPTHNRVPLRRSESRTFVTAPPQQRPNPPLNFQPQQNYTPRPPPNSYSQRTNQPINPNHQFRSQLSLQQIQRREEPPPPQNPQDYQRVYGNQSDKKPISFNPAQREPQQLPPQPNSPQNSQSPAILRPNNPGAVGRPNPWALLKQKLPADVRQQFVPIRRPQFDTRMQTPEQNMVQRAPGDGQNVNPIRVGSPNPGMQNPPMQNPNMQSNSNPGMMNQTPNPMQSPPPNPMYNGRPPSGNPPPKMGMPMQRPVSQEGRDNPSPMPGPGMQRMMSGERRSPFDLQRTDSMRTVDPRGLQPQGVSSPQGINSPQMYSPSPPRPMGDRGRETPPGPARAQKPPGDDDDDVVYSPQNDPRINLGRGQTPPAQMRPPSGPRASGPLPPDLNRDIISSRPLSRTESRQSFEVRSPNLMDNRGDPKIMPPMSRPLSSDLAKTPFQYRPEGQHTPPSSPKPEFQNQNTRPPVSPQDSLDRPRIDARGGTPQSLNLPASPKLASEMRPGSRNDDSGKLTPTSGRESSNPSPQPHFPFDLSKQETLNSGLERPLSGMVSPNIKSSDQSRSATPTLVVREPPLDSQNSKVSDISQSVSPSLTKIGSDSGTGTPLPDKFSGSNTREGTPIKTPDRSGTPDLERKEVERPTSLQRTSSQKMDLGSSPEPNSRKTPLVRTPSRTSSAGKQNDPKSPLQRSLSGKRPKTPKTPDGDHDSGVDESTQRKDGPTTNGDIGSPSKSPSKIPAPKKLSMPSPTKGSSKASPKTPEAPTTAEKKKVPMNKVQVGNAPSPNLKKVQSKIGSLQNATHKPGGGNVKIENKKLEWKAQPRIAAKNDTYQPGGGDKKIQQVKLQWNAKPKVGSLDNATHKPGGGEKKIESVKLDFKDKAKPKIGSLENATHKPGGGNVKSLDETTNGHAAEIEDQKFEIKAQSKIGSLDNVKHRPGGGERKIFDDKDYLRQMSGYTSKANSEGIPSGTQVEGGSRSSNTSRRSSRERRCSNDRRYRSESRLGRRTPDPGLNSPRTGEPHQSLRERHDQKQPGDVLREADTHDEANTAEDQDLISPLRPTSASSEQTMTRDSSEDKDLNSNDTNPSVHSDIMEIKTAAENNKENTDKQQAAENEKDRSTPSKFDPITKELDIITIEKNFHKAEVNLTNEGKSIKETADNEKDETEIANKKLDTQIDLTYQEGDLKPPKEETKSLDQKNDSNTEKKENISVKETKKEENLLNTREKSQEMNNEVLLHESKLEPKEDRVTEIKEVDSKEVIPRSQNIKAFESNQNIDLGRTGNMSNITSTTDQPNMAEGADLTNSQLSTA